MSADIQRSAARKRVRPPCTQQEQYMVLMDLLRGIKASRIGAANIAHGQVLIDHAYMVGALEAHLCALVERTLGHGAVDVVRSAMEYRPTQPEIDAWRTEMRKPEPD